MDLNKFDLHHRKLGYGVIAGVDEAGRGPWAGPVVAAAVVFPPDFRNKKIKDSKKLDARNREKLFLEINRRALSVGVGIIDQQTIDSVNILNATYLAMKKALAVLEPAPDLIIVDGHRKIPGVKTKQLAVIAGESKSLCVAAASIIAKVTRDRIMIDLSSQYPQYSFDKHKGYGTALHRRRLAEFGPCPLHRMSYAPVRERSFEE